MNIYFLLEGKRTEKKVYTAWLKYLLPQLSLEYEINNTNHNKYFLFSGFGYPSILNHLKNAILDINKTRNFDLLVLVIDAEEHTPEEQEKTVVDFINEQGLKLINCDFKILVQNRCIETWFLGNRKIFKNNPSNPLLSNYINFHNVKNDNPELMGKYQGFNTHAQFHLEYLKKLFAERNLSYTKTNPGEVLEKHYLDELLLRIEKSPNHLSSFKNLISICNEIPQ